MSPATYTTLPGLRVTRSGGGEMELFIDQQHQITARSFTRIFHQEKYGFMHFDYFIGEGFQIWYSEYSMLKKLNVKSKGSIPMLELHIPLEGGAMSWWDGKQDNRLRKHQFELGYLPFVNTTTEFAPHNKCITLDIHYDISFLALFAEQFPVLNNFLSNVELGQRTYLLDNSVRLLSPSMLRVVRDILNYPGTPEFAAFYYHQQVSMLLEKVLERVMNINENFSLKKYLDAATSVRELITSNASAIYTTRQLSTYTGINVSLLHKIFKEYHGTTIFDFSQGLRLEHAKQLLSDTNMYIFEIALECGYPEHANFTSAFRKRFGFTPQDYRDFTRGLNVAK